jgi:hypothetical protein
MIKLRKFTKITDLAMVGAGTHEINSIPGFESGSSRLYIQGSGKSKPGQKPTVQVERRRRGAGPGPETRERATAPQRQRPGEPGQAAPRPRETYPTSGIPTTSSGSGGMSAPPSLPNIPLGSLIPIIRRYPWLIIVVLVAVGICCVASMFLQTSQEGEIAGIQSEEPGAALLSPTEAPFIEQPTTTTRPFTPPAVTGEGTTWLVMLYQDADDKILEQDIYVDLNEAERVGSSENVQIVAQVDRFRAGYQGDGDWTSTRRYYITQDNDLRTVNSQLVADLGEVNMSAGESLVEFATWAIQTFPADKHVLILSDHGMGWPGGWSDPAPGGRGPSDIPLAEKLGDELYLNEIAAALGEIQSRTGLESFELIGMDACLMGHLEVFTALAPHARYAVASQEVEPALGWAYTGFLGELQANSSMSGADLGRFIVDAYIVEDQRIVDDQARAELLKQGSPLGGFFSLFGGGGGASPEQLAQQMGKGITLSAIDLSAIPQLQQSMNQLSFALQGAEQSEVSRARSYAQSFTNVFGQDTPASYLDLGNFVQLLKQEVRWQEVDQAADNLLAVLRNAVIAEKHGPSKPGASGISIYFPNSDLYRSPYTGPQSYTAIADSFADQSLWDDFLAFHYTGRTFNLSDVQVVVPAPEEEISAPGAGQFSISPIAASDDTAAPNQPVTLRADVSGQNIGYIYLWVGFYDQASNSIFVADMDYLESADTREIDGIYYPIWPEGGEFSVEFAWEPLVFAINDGVNSVMAMFTPETYGRTFEEAVYTVDGIYTYASGGESRYARLYFRNGVLEQVYGFTNQDGTGAPREIIPQTGDMFTVYEQWLDLDQNGNIVSEATQTGGSLTFGEYMFTWEDLYAAPGSYLVGFIVQDLDGATQEVYTEIIVE